MDDNAFVLPTTAYKRDINPMRDYVQDSATYLSKMTGRPLADCAEFVKQSLRPGGEFAFKDPGVVYLERQENGDRVRQEGTLLNYLRDAVASQDLIAPTFTTYVPPHKKKSLLVDFIDGNVAGRNKAKKEMFAAKQAGNTNLEAYKKGEQTGRKLSNNALSGAHVSSSTPLSNKTAHSTLTSTCRSTSGNGNSNNEKFLCGNRHYWSPDIVRNNIISIINHTDYQSLALVMAQYGIRHPTVEETMDCICYSTRLYWRGADEDARIRRLVESLSDAERSAFVYTSDLYHLMKFNDTLVRDFITKLSQRIVPERDVVPADLMMTDPDKVKDKEIAEKFDKFFKQFPDDNRNLASQLCPEELRGIQAKDLRGKPSAHIYAATCAHISEVLQEYKSLIRAFWVTPNMPASLARFPESIRRSALTSDTDSTIFTVQDWVLWYFGKIKFGNEGNAIAATMIFLASQTITHVLARMSANFGIEQKRMHQIAMKNEFKFDVFVPTQVAKHYYAIISCQEGNVFKKYEEEVKGVHLKSSNAPPSVMKEAKKMMEFIMMSPVEGKLISAKHIHTWIANIERQVRESVRKGSHEYFRKAIIKAPNAYVDGEEASPYQQYLLWKEVFAPKYGECPGLPFAAVKINADLDSAAKTRSWIDGMVDRELAGRIENWLARAGKKHMGGTFLLPEQCVTMNGIPEEILQMVNVRKIIIDTTKVFYLILESLGFYMINKKLTRLVSDVH